MDENELTLGRMPSNSVNSSWSISKRLLEMESDLGLCEYPDKVYKRLQFYGYELSSRATSNMGSLHRLEILRDSVNSQIGLLPVAEPNCIEQVSLNSVIQKKEACTEVNSVFWILMGESLGLQLTPLALHYGRILKHVTEDGTALFLDLNSGGHLMEDDDILDVLEASKGCPLTMEKFEKSLPLSKLFAKIGLLKTQFLNAEDDCKNLLKIYQLLIELEPGQCSYLAEKALLHLQLGQNRSAYNDLKRFFLLSDGKNKHPELMSLYQELKIEMDVESSLLSEEL